MERWDDMEGDFLSWAPHSHAVGRHLALCLMQREVGLTFDLSS